MKHLRTLALTTALGFAVTPAFADVTIRYLASQGGLSAHELAAELGYFDDTGITLENVGYAQGGPASLVALAGGSVELGSAATAAVLNSIAAGNDFVAAYPSNGINDEVQSVFYVLEDSPIKSVEDIVGKTVAVNTLGAHLDYAVRMAVLNVLHKRANWLFLFPDESKTAQFPDNLEAVITTRIDRLSPQSPAVGLRDFTVARSFHLAEVV